MKKLILPLLLLTTTASFAQQLPKDTTKLIPIHYTELVRANLQYEKSMQLLHKLDIPALKRDTIEANFYQIWYLLNRRAETVYSDTSKRGNK